MLRGAATWQPADRKLADGTPVEDVIICTDDIQSNIIISRGCYTAAQGKACHFCALGNHQAAVVVDDGEWVVRAGLHGENELVTSGSVDHAPTEGRSDTDVDCTEGRHEDSEYSLRWG